jgi:acetyl esterase/lipase
MALIESKNKFFIIVIFNLIISIMRLYTAENPARDKEIMLWPLIAPGSENLQLKEEIIERSSSQKITDRAIIKILNPSLIIMEPDNMLESNPAVLICPGGGYQRITIDKEGYDIARWLNSIGVAAFILKYRLPGEGHNEAFNVPLQDAQRAMRLIRKNAADWKIDPGKIGVIGFSAGAHVASTFGTLYSLSTYKPVDDADLLDCRPNFMMLIIL